MRDAEDDLALIDKALAQLARAHDAPLYRGVPRLDPGVFRQVHRGTVVQASAIAAARREESGKVTLTLRGRPEIH